MMGGFLDWLDEAAGGLIRVAYLVWGVVAVAAYFGDGTVPSAIVLLLAALAPWVLAFALETHTYLSARRVRAAWQGIQASSDGSDEHTRAVGALKVNLGILAGLLAFSMWNQLQYLGETWTPPHTSLALPGPVAYIIRAAITPLAFMAAAFLAPIGASLSAQVQAEAHHVAAEAFKVARQQWRDRLNEMRRNRQDVTAALVQLVEDPAERRIVETIHRAMYPGMDGALPALPAPSQRPPTGPGTPAVSPVRTDEAAEDWSHSIKLVAPPRPRRTKPQAKRVATMRGRQVRTGKRGTDPYDEEADAAWKAGARTLDAMMLATGMSKSAASKHLGILQAKYGNGDEGGEPHAIAQ